MAVLWILGQERCGGMFSRTYPIYAAKLGTVARLPAVRAGPGPLPALAAGQPQLALANAPAVAAAAAPPLLSEEARLRRGRRST